MARVISFDEMWSYVGARRRGKRREVWTWTAVVAEADGQHWVDFGVGDRSETIFLRLYGRLPERSVTGAIITGFMSGCPPTGIA